MIPGSEVTWRYVVTNDGASPLINLVVGDDQGEQVICPSGSNTIPLLVPGKSVTCTATGVATAGQYGNVGTVTGEVAVPPPGVDPNNPGSWPTDPSVYTPTGTNETDEDPSHYYGVDPSVNIEKEACSTGTGCGINDDAKWVETAIVEPGTAATFRITVTNTGDVDLIDVKVNDPKAQACNRTIGSLKIGESTTYTCVLDSVTGTLVNVADTIGYPVDPDGEKITDPVTGGPSEVTDSDDATHSVRSLISPDRPLPKTGNEVARILMLATLLIGAGVIALGLRRRRHTA